MLPWIPRERLLGWGHARQQDAGHARRRRSVIIAVICALAVAAVAASVFTVGQRAQALVVDAGQLHTVDEVLRASVVVQSQLTVANLLNNVDREYGTDSSVPIAQALTDARHGVAGLQAVREEDADRLRGAGLAAPTARLITDAEAAIALLERRRAATASMRAVAASFERTRRAAITQRERLEEQVASQNARLGRIGLLSTFIVAFVVPLCAALIYLMLTRQPRQELHRRIQAVRHGAFRARRARVIRVGLVDVRRALLSERGDSTASTLRRLEDLGRLLDLVEDERGQAFAPVPLDDVLDAAAAHAGERGIDVTVRRAGLEAHTDLDALQELIACLIAEVATRRAASVELATDLAPSGPRVWVAHDGAALPDDVVRVLHGGVWDDPTIGPRLTSALLLADGLGAGLTAAAQPRPAVVVTLPASDATPGVRPTARSAVRV